MADVVQSLLNAVDPSTTGTFYSTPAFDTKDYRDFTFVLRMPTQAGSGADTLDISIEASNTKSFTNYQTSVLALTKSDGTTGTALTQVVGGTTLPASTSTATTLRQTWYYNGKNIDRYIRVKYIVAGTATNITDITLDVLCNRKV